MRRFTSRNRHQRPNEAHRTIDEAIAECFKVVDVNPTSVASASDAPREGNEEAGNPPPSHSNNPQSTLDVTTTYDGLDVFEHPSTSHAQTNAVETLCNVSNEVLRATPSWSRLWGFPY